MIKWPEEPIIRKKQSKIHNIYLEDGMYNIVVDKNGANNTLYMPDNVITDMELKVGTEIISLWRGKKIVGIKMPKAQVSYIMPVGA